MQWGLNRIFRYGVQWVDVVTNPANYLGPDGQPMDSNPKKQRMNTAMGAQRCAAAASQPNRSPLSI
jgi:hypothetical protein